ncbi:flagellar hook-basal body complex protein FliE [Arthrobacter sp. JSM 101049]|uniref:flagellar hook-basal body complex protein FliE n=1 Tax=Arthrobacter sp. JSM 101049 TaxID=929097 RepID=UPI00356A3017
MPAVVPPIAGSIPSVTSVAPTTPTGYAGKAEGPSTDGSQFASTLAGAVDNVQELKGVSNELAIQAVTGDLTDIHAATLASARSSIALEMAATFRNRGVEAFNEIMRMQA